MQRTLDVHFDELVIGADLSALSYAYNRRLPIIYTRLQRPHKFQFEIEDEKINRYNDMLFNLSYSSLVPFSNLIENIRIEDANTLKATTKSNILINVSFNNLSISDEYKLEGLPAPISKTSEENVVLDKFLIRFAKNCDNIKLLKFNSDVLNTLHIYQRKCSGSPSYDCISVSKIFDSDLEKFECSQTFIRINVNKILKENNFRGRWDKTNQRFKIISLVSDERIILPVGKNIYDSLYTNHKMLYNEEPTEIIQIDEKSRIYV